METQNSIVTNIKEKQEYM